MLAPALTDRLICPKSKQALVYIASESCLVAPEARLRYRIEAGVPVLLAEEAEIVSEDELTWLLARRGTEP